MNRSHTESMARAASLHLEGKAEQALQELCRAREEGDHSASLCETALRLNPGNHEALYLDARCYEELGQKERARALFQYLIAVFPGSESANLAKQALHDIDRSGPKQASAPPTSMVSERAPYLSHRV